VRPIGELIDGKAEDLLRWTPDGASVNGAIEVRL
jgi:hypothetical protein